VKIMSELRFIYTWKIGGSNRICSFRLSRKTMAREEVAGETEGRTIVEPATTCHKRKWKVTYRRKRLPQLCRFNPGPIMDLLALETETMRVCR
jgi:hypothetical protein